MIKLLPFQNVQQINNSARQTIKQSNFQGYPQINELSNYPISFCSAQILQHSKGSTIQVAKQLKSLDGTLDEKLPKAKDIILKDMGLPCDLVECVDTDLGGKGYAAYSAPLGKILFDKNYCQRPDSEFSNEAVMCILRHELDHMEVFAKLYKKLGGDEFEKLLPELYGENMPKVNHEFYKEMSKHVDIEGFDADKYVNAIKNYYKGANLDAKPYEKFTGITKNFDNELENSARDKQIQLESLMGVSTLKDFYSMIDETAKLTAEIKAKGVTDEKAVQETFDNLYEKAQKLTGLEDKTPNWGKILKEARTLNKQ